MYGYQDTVATCPFCRYEHDITPSDVSNRFTTTCKCGVRLFIDREDATVVSAETTPPTLVDIKTSIDYQINPEEFDSVEDVVEHVTEQIVSNPSLLDVSVTNERAITATQPVPNGEQRQIPHEILERVLDEYPVPARRLKTPSRAEFAANVLAGHLVHELEQPVSFDTAVETILEHAGPKPKHEL